jgi:hypothetical protein
VASAPRGRVKSSLLAILLAPGWRYARIDRCQVVTFEEASGAKSDRRESRRRSSPSLPREPHRLLPQEVAPSRPAKRKRASPAFAFARRWSSGAMGRLPPPGSRLPIALLLGFPVAKVWPVIPNQSRGGVKLGGSGKADALSCVSLCSTLAAFTERTGAGIGLLGMEPQRAAGGYPPHSTPRRAHDRLKHRDEAARARRRVPAWFHARIRCAICRDFPVIALAAHCFSRFKVVSS